MAGKNKLEEGDRRRWRGFAPVEYDLRAPLTREPETRDEYQPIGLIFEHRQQTDFIAYRHVCLF